MLSSQFSFWMKIFNFKIYVDDFFTYLNCTYSFERSLNDDKIFFHFLDQKLIITFQK